MRYPACEKAEIIRIVEQSNLPAKATLAQIGVPRATFYRWYDRYQAGGPEALTDRPAQPGRVWNRIADDVRAAIITLALEQSELSPRELAVRFTHERSYFVSEASVYRLLKAHDLITSPVFIVIKAASEFTDKTSAPNEMWQTDFTYLKIIGWGWMYLSTILDDFSRYIIAWKLCTTMKTTDVTDTLQLALGIRSERRLCDEVHLNLAYRWFCRLGLDGNVPDHSTFSKNRHGRFRDSDLLRRLFETTVERCMAEGLVGGEGFAVDASLIRADANRQTGDPGSEGLPPDADNRAVREYLAVLDDAAFGAATPVVPKFLAPADPASRWTSAHHGPAFYAYSTNYLIDLDHAVIMDVEASTAVRQAEVTACKRMITRVQDRFGVWPERLAADTAYGSAEMLAWLVHERDIHPHIPVFDKSARRDGTFERSDFTYDHADDSYVCPGGKRLRPRNRNFATPRSGVNQDGSIRYRARQQDCTGCDLRQRCTPNMPARKVTRSIHEGARDLARDIATTDAYVTSRRQRKKVEMLFAHLKRILKLDRLRLRGPNGAKDEFLLAATAQNLRKMAKLIPMPAQPLPA